VVVRVSLSRIETDLSRLGAERNGTTNTFQNVEDLDRDGDDHDVVSLVEISSDSEGSEAGQDESQEESIGVDDDDVVFIVESSSDSESSEVGQDESQDESIDVDDFGEDNDSDSEEYNSP
jgi:hypothetical protein